MKSFAGWLSETLHPKKPASRSGYLPLVLPAQHPLLAQKQPARQRIVHRAPIAVEAAVVGVLYVHGGLQSDNPG